MKRIWEYLVQLNRKTGNNLAAGLFIASVIGLVIGLPVGVFLGPMHGLFIGLAAGLAAGLLAGLFLGSTIGLLTGLSVFAGWGIGIGLVCLILAFGWESAFAVAIAAVCGAAVLCIVELLGTHHRSERVLAGNGD